MVHREARHAFAAMRESGSSWTRFRLVLVSDSVWRSGLPGDLARQRKVVNARFYIGKRNGRAYWSCSDSGYSYTGRTSVISHAMVQQLMWMKVA
jgi:hypothetical protein